MVAEYFSQCIYYNLFNQPLLNILNMSFSVPGLFPWNKFLGCISASKDMSSYKSLILQKAWPTYLSVKNMSVHLVKLVHFTNIS